MSVSNSMKIGTVIGGALGGAAGYMISGSEDVAVSCVILGGAGSLGGAILGGAVALARKLNPVAIGALLGGGAGTLGGSFLCTFASAGVNVFGGSDSDLFCFMGGCTGVATAAGAATGAGIAKITMISQKRLEQTEKTHDE